MDSFALSKRTGVHNTVAYQLQQTESESLVGEFKTGFREGRSNTDQMLSQQSLHGVQLADPPFVFLIWAENPKGYH